MQIYDISTPLTEKMPCFPGDPVFRSDRLHAIARGDPYNISTLQFGSHAGTHVDPPLHFVPGGASADELSLAELNGPCFVLEVAETSRSIGPPELGRVPEGTRRLLLKSSNSRRWKAGDSFFSDYVALERGGRGLVPRPSGEARWNRFVVDREGFDRNVSRPPSTVVKVRPDRGRPSPRGGGGGSV